MEVSTIAISNIINKTASCSSDPNRLTAIAVRGVDMVFTSPQQSFQALKAINLDVAEGTVHLVMGPSGAGKTTLLFIIAGLLTPTVGEVTLLGQSLKEMSRHNLERFRSQQMGIVFQDLGLLRTLTALENVKLALNMKGIRGQSARQQAQSLLEAVGLGDKLNLLPRLLSVGQQQRIGVARALAGQPQLIIADEPTSALDSVTGRIVADLFRQQAQEHGSTVLIATHDYRIMPFADRISYLEDGMITVDKPLSV